MLGVIASFPYCGDVNSRLALKRRPSPRIRVEKGSIAIANRQTIIIPLASPSGWHMIGRTPMDTFNPSLHPPSPFLAGDYLKFEPISPQEAESWNDSKQSEWNEKWNSLRS
jgi:inhibitor of KinA